MILLPLGTVSFSNAVCPMSSPFYPASLSVSFEQDEGFYRRPIVPVQLALVLQGEGKCQRVVDRGYADFREFIF
jgi:hypothetical protein